MLACAAVHEHAHANGLDRDDTNGQVIEGGTRESSSKMEGGVRYARFSMVDECRTKMVLLLQISPQQGKGGGALRFAVCTQWVVQAVPI